MVFFQIELKLCQNVSALVSEMWALKGSNHRVLFQNAEGNINMGVWFNDPDIEMEDIFWYHVLAKAMHNSLVRSEGLISIGDKLGTLSCYVVLHRNGINYTV